MSSFHCLPFIVFLSCLPFVVFLSLSAFHCLPPFHLETVLPEGKHLLSRNKRIPRVIRQENDPTCKMSAAQSTANRKSSNHCKVTLLKGWPVMVIDCMLTPYKYCSLWMDTGKDPSKRGRHQALAVFIQDHGLKGTSIVQRTQERNSFGCSSRHGWIAFNACTVNCFHILGWNDAFFDTLPWDLWAESAQLYPTKDILLLLQILTSLPTTRTDPSISHSPLVKSCLIWLFRSWQPLAIRFRNGAARPAACTRLKSAARTLSFRGHFFQSIEMSLSHSSSVV